MIKSKTWALAAAASLVFVIQSLWLPAKAQLGQLLLERNWQQVVAGKPAASAWPGADIQAVAQLEVPALGIRQLLVAGQQGKNLAWAPGLVSADRPGLSDTVVSAHRDSHFRFLEEIKVGDRIVLTTASASFEYQVESMEVVDSKIHHLQLQTDGQHLLLTTCYPFDALQSGGALRYVVTAVAT